MMSHREGDWWVTTPLYVGTQDEVLAATRCWHARYAADVLPPKTDSIVEAVPGLTEFIVERCAKCCARRVRYKGDLAHVSVFDPKVRG